METTLRTALGLTIGLLCFFSTHARAGERWPANVCAEVLRLERSNELTYSKHPYLLATARGDALYMLSEHCPAVSTTIMDVKAVVDADQRVIDAHSQAVYEGTKAGTIKLGGGYCDE